MSKSQKFFRYLWRIDAVVIFLAAAAIAIGVGSLLIGEIGARTARYRDAETAIPIVAADSDAHLSLGRVSLVAGTSVMRAELSRDREGKGFGSSGGYSETRNVLFIEPDQKDARWLLPDNSHIVSDNSDITTEGTDRDSKRMVATAVLVKSSMDSSKTAGGRLLLFDATGRKIVDVANNVRQIHLTSLVGGELTILFERNGRLVLATFDPASLVKRGEQEIGLPQLK